MSAQALAEPPQQNERDMTDDLFWLSRLDDSVPRAQIIPDFKRSADGERQYESVEFAVDGRASAILRSLDSAVGVSDLALCVTLTGVLLAKYQLQDEFVIGMQAPAGTAAEGGVLPLRLACRRERSVATLMRSVIEEISEVSSRPAFPVPRMAQMLGVQLAENRCPFFDIAVAVNSPRAAYDVRSFPVDVALLFDVNAGEIRGRIVYAAELFERPRMEAMAGHLANAVSALCEEPGIPLREVELLSPDEHERVVHGLSGYARPFELDSTMHGEFEAWAERTPDAPAVVHGEATVTYAELNARANRLAQCLLHLGLRRGEFVGILLHRGVDFVVSMLAVFKAGGAYVPLDPTYPRDRMRYMIEDSQAAKIISDATLLTAFEDVMNAPTVEVVLAMSGEVREPLHERGAGARYTVLGPDQIAAQPAATPGVRLRGADRAYMIYTSGSTGKPKGAICRHDGALNHLYGELEGLSIDRPFRFLQTAASSSDISVWQFMAPLAFGGATVIADYCVVVDPELLFATMRTHRVNVAELVPVVLRGLVDHVSGLPADARRLDDLDYMMASGEALSAELVDRWLALYPGIPIANTYGPTETSDDVTLMVMREPLHERRAVVPIGRPLPNTYIFILDRDLRPVPIGTPGEICIAGIAVGEGYWRQPEKTQASFVTSPFPDVAPGSMYRSGDLGRWLPDGTVEFLGRIDQQVKVRGFRVEPGEVEVILTQHPGVQDAAVVAVRDGNGTNRLVGYYVNRAGQSVTPVELRQFAKGALAEHMIPSALVPLAKLPLTPLGKVDRKALSHIDYEGHEERTDYVAPRDSLEATLASSWSAVLGRRLVSIHDNFFEIGGDSISVIHVVAELKRSGIAVAPKAFFLYPTIAGLASEVKRAGAPKADEPSARLASDARWDVNGWRSALSAQFPDVDDVFPLGATQRGIYLQTLLPARTSGAYVEQIAFVLSGQLDKDTLAKAWQYTVNATPALRTAIVRRGVPQPVQAVVRGRASAPRFEDWTGMDEAGQKAAIDSLLADDRRAGFDLKSPPLTRLTVARLSESRWYFLWTYHHVILDGWSEPLVLSTLFSAYDAIKVHRIPQAERAGRYRDFVAACESLDMAAAEQFWRQHLAGYSAPVTVKDESPAVQPPAPAELSHGWEEVILAHEELQALNDSARASKLTLGTMFHGAWAMLLHRRSGKPDVVFGGVASGRQCAVPNAESIRGVLVATQPVRTRLAPDASVSSWLRSLQLQMAEMREFEQTPLALIHQWSEVPADRRPLFDTLVVLANYVGSDLAHIHPAGMKLGEVAYYTQPLFALTLFVTGGPRPAVRIVYDKKRYSSATVLSLLEEYRELLLSFAQHPEQRCASVSSAKLDRRARTMDQE